jgi:hypothetical protein
MEGRFREGGTASVARRLVLGAGPGTVESYQSGDSDGDDRRSQKLARRRRGGSTLPAGGAGPNSGAHHVLPAG